MFIFYTEWANPRLSALMIPAHRSRGFTLLELLVTLAVMAVALGMGIPAYKNMVSNSQASAAANDLMMMAQAARAQAMRTRVRVVMCPTRDGSRCAGNDWSRAISGLDANRNDTIDSNETILRRVELARNVRAQAAGTLPLIFLPDGTARMGQSSNDGINNPDAILICTTNADEPGRWVRVGFSSAQTEIVRGTTDDCR